MRRFSERLRAITLAARVVPAVFLAGAALLTATAGPAGAGSRSQAFTLYSTPTKHQFVNNTDDLARGEGHNPFGNYTSSSITTRANERLFGPFPGDEGEYAFSLSTSASHKTGAGSAIFICQYGFNLNALCDAAFQLDGGTLVGKGPVDFNSGKATLAIIGGTFKYRTTRGKVDLSALGSATQAQPVYRPVPMLQAQRLAFLIQPA